MSNDLRRAISDLHDSFYDQPSIAGIIDTVIDRLRRDSPLPFPSLHLHQEPREPPSAIWRWHCVKLGFAQWQQRHWKPRLTNASDTL
jgi:hypothetical protein